MMVKRYYESCTGQGGMFQGDSGPWVEYHDFAALETELAELRAAINWYMSIPPEGTRPLLRVVDEPHDGAPYYAAEYYDTFDEALLIAYRAHLAAKDTEGG